MMTTKQIKTAFILGAGLGTRLRPLSENMPKPLLKIGGRPIITYAMEQLRAAGVGRFIVNTHHCAEKYAGVFPKNNWEGIPITFRHEPVLLDTAGGIKNIEDLIIEDERIIVCNGDIITNMPLTPLIEKHFKLKTVVTLALRSSGPLLNVSIDKEGFVCDMRHILKNHGVMNCLFTGIYIVEKDFLKRLKACKIESIVLPLVEMIKENPRSVGGVVIDNGYWHDVGTIEEYEKLKQAGFEKHPSAPIQLGLRCKMHINPGNDKRVEIMHKEIQKYLSEYFGNADFTLEPIKKGGSDRSFIRIFLPDKTSFIFMHYGDEVAENTRWADINKFMASLDINVPRIIARDESLHFILLEDLGDVDLWSQRFLRWEERRDYYFQALTQIYRLHSFDLNSRPSGLQLSESYGPGLYKWEHDYFLENLVWEVCKIKLSSSDSAKLMKELDALSARLQKIEPCFIHRDFQSQNIMIKNSRPVLIDFQGMRQGCLFYDLGSLICDPYITLDDEERNELINYYYELLNPAYSLDEFVHNFWIGSVQRLLQALGAYGFLGLKKHKPAFFGHIGNGLENLLTAIDNAGGLDALNELATECETILTRKNY